jgi:isoamylase
MVASATPSFPYPLGVTVVEGGVNVALYSSVADGVTFSTFDSTGAESRHRLTLVDSDIWHGVVPGVGPGQEYGFRVSGPYSPPAGVRCNPAKLLLDPYGRSVTGNLAWKPSWNGAAAGAPNSADSTDSAPDAPRSVVVRSTFDWGGDAPLGRAAADSIIYELHVKGFTAGHPAVPAADLRPARRLLVGAASRRSPRLGDRRVQGHGEDAAHGGDRGPLGRRLQSYRRGQ